jgi:hypothetical protein
MEKVRQIERIVGQMNETSVFYVTRKGNNFVEVRGSGGFAQRKGGVRCYVTIFIKIQ